MPSGPSKFPAELTYDQSQRRVSVGEAFIENLSSEVRAFGV